MNKLYTILFILLGFSLAANGQDTVYMTPVIIQFSTGDTGFPQPGDSLYTNTSLINFSFPLIQVWREHLLQYSVGTDRVSFNDSTGTIRFYPVLNEGERIMIEREEKQHIQ